MRSLTRWARLIVLVAIMFAVLPSTARERANTGRNAYLPDVANPPGPPSPFGFDVNSYYDDRVLSFAREANPRWVRSGDVLWADVEREPGVYDWSALASVEANVLRLRQLGFEPVVIVQRSPAWAQRVPGRLCSPPKPEHLDSFARFMNAVAARYSSGPFAIHYWEIWNEPDYRAEEVQDYQGFGCWADPGLPYFGGGYYGEALKRVYPAIKAGNPNAFVLGGALAYQWPDETISREFLRGILASGAGGSFDALSFHAYGEWGGGDLLLAKTTRLRAILAEFGLAGKPLFATEIAATCFSVYNLGQMPATTCPSDFGRRQANYAARIYAETIALDLAGALWFTLVAAGPQFTANAQLIDDNNGDLVPRPSFYAFRNSARLLAGARYIGPPISEPPPDQLGQVQVLTFKKGNNTLYVLWVPLTDYPKFYDLPVPPGATAVCTEQLSSETPKNYYCSDFNGDGLISRGVNELPQYVEIIGQ